MTFYRKRWTKTLGAVSATCLSACAGGTSLSLPSASDVGSVSPSTAPNISDSQAVGSATELYSRVALGAMTCWFGASGPLKKDYIYHAEADAASRGGKAEIVIHQRDPTQPNPRGAKAYRINIEPAGESAAAIKTENLKMTDAFAAGMSADVGRWAKGDQGCAGNSTALGWNVAAPPQAEPVAKPSKKKAKHTAKAAKPVAER